MLMLKPVVPPGFCVHKTDNFGPITQNKASRPFWSQYKTLPEHFESGNHFFPTSLNIFVVWTLVITATTIFSSNIFGTPQTLTLPASPLLENVDPSTLTPTDAYRYLVAGNARYLGQETETVNELPTLIQGENPLPIATVFYSSEMKSLPSEYMKLNSSDLYQVPLNRKTFSPNELADLEFGVTNLQTPLVVVLSVFPNDELLKLITQFDQLESKAKEEIAKIDPSTQTFKTTNETPEDQLIQLYNLVGPAIARARNAYPDLPPNELVNLVAEAIVWQSMEAILMQSSTVNDLLKNDAINLIGALLDETTGQIYWLGSHPLQAEFLKETPEKIIQLSEKIEKPIDEAELPEPVNETIINNYITEYHTTNRYNSVIDDYYLNPYFYEPAWQMFYPTVWIYRPHYGVWVKPFIPHPCYNPWAPPGVNVNFGLSFNRGRLNFYIGSWLPLITPIYIPSGFRPHDPFWNTDFYFNHRRPPVPHIPPRPLFPPRPAPFHPTHPIKPGPHPRPIPDRPDKPNRPDNPIRPDRPDKPN
ncbi:MAG: hypothetical protein Q4C95_06450, partial [Planctomycetia bacterium]|nr:hypothetical protein [Planctomycetia bacterium]